MAEPVGKPVEGERYHDLDALRGVLMLVGVFVHVSTLGVDPVFDFIARASGLFRMETFFVVSGFLSTMLVAKYGATRAVRRRLVAVGVPLLATQLVFNPPTLWMSSVFHSGHEMSFAEFLRIGSGEALAGRLNWYLHLWFLLVLVGYVLLTPAAVGALRAVATTRAYQLATAGRLRAMTAITLVVLALMAAGRACWSGALEPVLGSGFHADLLRRVLEFLPFFLLGVLLHLDRARLLPLFSRPAPVVLVVYALLLAVSWGRWVSVLSGGTGRALVETLFALPVIATLFAVANRFGSRPRPVFQYLSDASYTVYLLHFFWIFAFARLLGMDPSLGFAQMAVLVVATYAATFASHHFVVRRSVLLRRIFNGRSIRGSAGAREMQGGAVTSIDLPGRPADTAGRPAAQIERVSSAR
ncbi:glucans biosynthesis protein MdoC [Parafrankia sp. EUN1f]|uniref:glucans biosynthesis protein MdoC n=1 Tax=Parafrankia sp. EUN1f TaxID=102897 RepID=UPI0001C43ACE|nr:glucans biosynthesis protein MdoC [Parafrankia sp. EUN1f]EFC83060.1 acyltransferase 3 [Parafrankia sp. EUN1f]